MAVLLILTTLDRADAAEVPLVDSLLAQDRGDWHLGVLGADLGHEDPRIDSIASPADVWNAGHDLVTLLDPGTNLHPGAVGHLVDAMGARPDADAVYGDDIRPRDPTWPLRLRPAWSPEAIRASWCVGDPFVVRRRALESWMPPDSSRASRYRMALEMVERDASVVHLPCPLATLDQPPAADWSPVDVVDGHLRRCQVPARAVAGPEPGTVRLEPAFTEPPPVSVVVPTAGARDPDGSRLVARCLASLDQLDWPELEIVVVVGDEYDGDPADLATAGRHPVRIVRRTPGEFSFATAVNTGVLAAHGDLVVLLNDDTEALDGDWLSRLAVHALDPAVGAVGVTLLFPDETIQHVGMVVDDARPLHPFVGQRADDDGPRVITSHPRTVAAVTAACLAVERHKYLAVGGLSERFPLSFNDVDLCFKLARHGHRTVHEPGARLIHHEGASRHGSIELWEWDRFIHRWGLVEDPWYHPGYVRPRDPDDPRRDGDHLLPADPPCDPRPRDTVLRPTVHRARPEGPAVDTR